MDTCIELVRWYNRACPFHWQKGRLTRWAERRNRWQQGMCLVNGIQGSARMRLDLSRQFERTIYLNYHEVQTARVLRALLRPGDTFVDGGANLGVFTLLGAARVSPGGRVYAFEPHPEFLQRLHEHVSLNDASNVTVVPKGCWDSAGTATLHYYRYGEGGKEGPGGLQPSAAIEFHSETARIDDIVPGPVKVVKLDVEGAEFAALRGMERLIRSESPPNLIVELSAVSASNFRFTPRELVDWVMRACPAYRIRTLLRRSIEPFDPRRLPHLLANGRCVNLWFGF